MSERDLIYALSIGITYDEFWRLNPKKLSYYAKSEKLKIKEQDFMNYMLGLYVRVAVASVLDKKSKYPKEPMLKDIEEEKRFDDDLFMAQLKQFADVHNKNYKKKKVGENK